MMNYMKGVFRAAMLYVRSGKVLFILLVSSVCKTLGPVSLCNEAF